MKRVKSLAVAAAVLAAASAAWADWEPGQPFKMHFPQLPDIESGMNVLATFPKFLGDDWQCTQTGPVTDIHIWGSWLDDVVLQPAFDVSIWSDDPVGPGGTNPDNQYSMPDKLLWGRLFEPGQYVDRPWAQAEEPFFDPNTNEIIGMDFTIWQYNFFIDPTEIPFHQREGEIYWLVVSAMLPPGANGLFGWKTSRDHFQDDAVFGDMPVDGAGIVDWHELIDPRTGESLDLAFVITPEPATVALVGLGLAALVARRRRKVR